MAEKALVDERLERVQVGARHLLGVGERAAAREGRKVGEGLLLGSREQLVAPVDRRPQRALPLGQVPGTTGQERQALREALEDLVGRERLDARGGELERERQVVETAADLRDRLVALEVGLDRLRARQEEADTLVGRERRHLVHLLRVHAQRLPARHEQIEVRTRGEQPGNVSRSVDDLLEVVEDDQQRLAGDVLDETVLGAERLRGALERPAADRAAAASGTHQTPCGYRAASSPAICSASRVLPVPPGRSA